MASITLNTTTSYQRGTYPFPKDDIPPSQKNKEWGKQWCEAMYAAYLTDRTGIPFSQISEFYDLRRYGSGTQDISKYQNILLDESDESEELEGYMNLNWDIFSVMPKFKHIVRGIFEDQEFDIVATAVDPKSNETRELTKLRKWFKARYKPLIDNINEMQGFKPRPEWLPDTIDELEMYSMAGGFKLSKENEIEEALNYTFYISDWSETRRKLFDDFMDINCAATKDYTDQYTRKVKTRYVDPLNLIIQYSRHWDHRNSEYAGEVIKETISNIRKNTDLSEDQLRNLAQFYNGRNSNRNISSWTEEDLLTPTGDFIYDNFQIDVMDAEWFSINKKYRTTRETKRGDKLSYDSEYGKVYDSDKKKTKITQYKTVYRCKWIIGTDFTYDFGLQYDVPRPGKKEVELSYKFYKLPGRSIVSLSVPNLDQIQLTWLKLQNALAMSSNKGIAVEYTSLMNMKLGGDKLEPLEILSIRRDTGDLIYKLTTHQGRPNVPGGMRPIQELEGGIGAQLNEFMSLFQMNLEFIRDLTGINRIADASSPDPNQSVKGSQLAMVSTTNALKPIYAGYIRLKEQVARSCAIRVQMLVKYDKKAYEGYIPVVGGAGVKILSIGADIIDADYEIKIQAKPTQERKQTILQAAIQSMQPDRDGYVGIEQQDFMMIERLLESGNEKLAEMMLNFRSQKNKQRQVQLQRENMKLDAENQQKSKMVSAEEDRKTKEFDNQLKIQYEEAKTKNENWLKQQDHMRKMEELQYEKGLETKSA